MEQKYEQKQNTGAIFKNDKKTSEKHPDYRGKINVNGHDLEIALWLKESAKGVKYFSASISEPYVPEQNTENNTTTTEQDDDLPF